MINEESITKLYETIISGNELTTKELNGYGFNSKDLTDLISDGVLKRVSRGHYSIVSVEGLFSYGKKLIKHEEYSKAKICFEKCYDLDKMHLPTCFQLFFINIYEYHYDNVFEYFDAFYFSDNEYYNSDNNFYFYLLNIIN